MERPKNRLAPLIVAGVLCAVLVVYVVGYFAASISDVQPAPGIRVRAFDARWQALIYVPATKIESLLTGDTVHCGFVDKSQPLAVPGAPVQQPPVVPGQNLPPVEVLIR